MGKKLALLLILAFLPALTGCPVFQSQDTPVAQIKTREPLAGSDYWLYVPSSYDAARQWPLVITLHGTYGFDSASAQIREWKALAESEGFLVAAPELKSVQGILPVVKSWWKNDLLRDEQTILALLDHLSNRYNIHPQAVLLTGFSAGGYPMYFTGLRNPQPFGALAARACNSHPFLFEQVEVTEAMKKLPVFIVHGQDDFGSINKQSWAAFRWLRQQGNLEADHEKIPGGHIRRPQAAWQWYKRRLPLELRQTNR